MKFFCDYLVNETDLTEAEEARGIKLTEFNKIKAVDVNIFIEYCRKYEVETEDSITVYENGNKTLARKKSSLSVLFKQLFRDEMLENNITDGFDPIRVPKPGEKEIKALQDDEVMIMLDAVTNGSGLTPKELQYWEKTKYRDKAILIVFLTYGLRLSELQQLNVSSFNFNRGEFKIYRKRGKESTMPLNRSVTQVINDYLKLERPPDDELEDLHKDALFLSLQGKRMTERAIRDLVKKYTSIGMAVLIILAAAAVNFAFNSIDVRAENHPSYVTVQVSDGDTLWSIAEQYMSDTNDTREAVYDIQKANNMSGNDNLTVGSTIKVPVCE